MQNCDHILSSFPAAIGIRRFWFGVSLLSPLRPILRNGNPFLKFLGNAFTGERILQRPTPRHLWATDRPGMCYPTCPFRVIRGCHIKGVRIKIRFVHLLENKILVILLYFKMASYLLVTKFSLPSGGGSEK